MVLGSNGTMSTSSESIAIKQPSHTLQVEARLVDNIPVNYPQVRDRVTAYLQQYPILQCDTIVEGWQGDALLGVHVESIRICESSSKRVTSFPTSGVSIQVNAYKAAAQDDIDEMDLEGDEQGQDDVMAATVMELPNTALEGVWESLVYEDDVKARLFNYISATLLFSDAKVDFNLISWNRLVLLHGPPGTGKTSLCRALAQKLAIRLSSRYICGRLIEINSHSLFSKWFSESGKLVQKLFTMVHEMVEDEDNLVIILIDEVESLTTARSSSLSGSEPGDAVRVVNALLTQLDKLKQKSNVLIMTTSNLSHSIDNAFMDRADIKQYIGSPPPEAIYAILSSCLKELMRVKMVSTVELCNWNEITSTQRSSQELARLASKCKGFSGRTLRRLPVLAHTKVFSYASSLQPIDYWQWLAGLEEAINDTIEAIEATQKPAS